MAKEIRCADLGMKCNWVGKGSTEEEVLKTAATHAATAHQMAKIDEPMMAKMKAIIRTV
jgi:predicted small metal-binding protein